MLVAQEIVRPYHRPPLSKEYLRKEKTREELFTLGRDWFEANHVELRTGRRAAHLDVSRNTITLDQGEVIGYDKLLLATGMSPRQLEIPGASLPNLFYLRTLADAEHLQKAIEKSTHEGLPHVPGARAGSRGRAVVIGTGVLGVELAASLTQTRVSVDLLCGHAHPWEKFAGEITGKALATYLEKKGIRVHLNATPQRLEGDGRVQRVILPDGMSLDCDFAVAAVGAVTNRDLLRGTPISAEKAILTDSHCRTNIANIYAAGDSAAIFDPLFGKHRILDHWDNAVVTGTLAGRNMAGCDEAYNAVNNFFSDVFALSLNGWGESRQVNHRIVRSARVENSNEPDLIEIGIAADGRVAQVLAVGHSADQDLLRDLVARRAKIDGLEERLKDPAAPLQDLIA
jgi:NADPH-dependent 2,4-dienoyl-CoA reductase/sulfur reductase-like enzyme